MGALPGRQDCTPNPHGPGWGSRGGCGEAGSPPISVLTPPRRDKTLCKSTRRHAQSSPTRWKATAWAQPCISRRRVPTPVWGQLAAAPRQGRVLPELGRSLAAVADGCRTPPRRQTGKVPSSAPAPATPDGCKVRGRRPALPARGREEQGPNRGATPRLRGDAPSPRGCIAPALAPLAASSGPAGRIQPQGWPHHQAAPAARPRGVRAPHGQPGPRSQGETWGVTEGAPRAPHPGVWAPAPRPRGCWERAGCDTAGWRKPRPCPGRTRAPATLRRSPNGGRTGVGGLPFLPAPLP